MSIFGCDCFCRTNILIPFLLFAFFIFLPLASCNSSSNSTNSHYFEEEKIKFITQVLGKWKRKNNTRKVSTKCFNVLVTCILANKFMFGKREKKPKRKQNHIDNLQMPTRIPRLRILHGTKQFFCFLSIWLWDCFFFPRHEKCLKPKSTLGMCLCEIIGWMRSPSELCLLAQSKYTKTNDRSVRVQHQH